MATKRNILRGETLTARLLPTGLTFEKVTAVDDPRCGLATISTAYHVPASPKQINDALEQIGYRRIRVRPTTLHHPNCPRAVDPRNESCDCAALWKTSP